MGELALDGVLRPIRGALPIAINARQDGFKGIILPEENAAEAAVVSGLDVFYANHIQQVIDFFEGKSTLPKAEINIEQIFF